ncbi:MAG: septum site-determining protein MinC [Anaerolineae bacterium]
MTTGNVTIKGMREGLLVTLGAGGWDALLLELAERLERTAAFFRGAQVTLDVAARELDSEQLQAVEELFARGGATLETVLSTAQATRQAAQALGFHTAPEPSREVPRAKPRAERELEGGLLVRRTLRSGQAIRHPGHVVVIGDVNAGAEVVAGGDVVVWGRLRGLVHAGAMGDDEALVCALSLAPTQLRIGNHIARPPDDDELARQSQARGAALSRRASSPEDAAGAATPEMARVRNGRIVVEPWR